MFIHSPGFGANPGHSSRTLAQQNTGGRRGETSSQHRLFISLPRGSRNNDPMARVPRVYAPRLLTAAPAGLGGWWGGGGRNGAAAGVPRAGALGH